MSGLDLQSFAAFIFYALSFTTNIITSSQCVLSHIIG